MISICLLSFPLKKKQIIYFPDSNLVSSWYPIDDFFVSPTYLSPSPATLPLPFSHFRSWPLPRRSPRDLLSLTVSRTRLRNFWKNALSIAGWTRWWLSRRPPLAASPSRWLLPSPRLLVSSLARRPINCLRRRSRSKVGADRLRASAPRRIVEKVIYPIGGAGYRFWTIPPSQRVPRKWRLRVDGLRYTINTTNSLPSFSRPIGCRIGQLHLPIGVGGSFPAVISVK